jgi:hypothetical protein
MAMDHGFVARRKSMGFVRRLGLSVAMVIIVASTLQAAMPAADLALTKRKPAAAAGSLQAVVEHETFVAPANAVPPPASPVVLSGQGISVYYLIPYDRVKNILPPELAPFPGPQTIWFRVDFIQWTSAEAGSVRQKRFTELAYRFEIKCGKERGTYPVRIYADQPWAVLWMRRVEHYEAYLMPAADVNFSPFIHFLQMRKSIFPLAMVDAKPRQGMGANMGDIFGRKDDSLLWNGGRKDYLFLDNAQGPVHISRDFTVDLKPAQAESLFLSEPQKWRILGEDEIHRPAKVFILESIDGTWAERRP